MTNTIILSSNSCWNIINFRLGIIDALMEEGWAVHCIVPEDQYMERLSEKGVRIHIINLNPGGQNPILELFTFFQYFFILLKLKPSVYLSFTIKPNIYGGIVCRLLHIPTIINISGLGSSFLNPTKSSRFINALYKLSLSRARVFFQNVDDEQLFRSQKLLTEHSRVQVIPGSGVNLERFSYPQTIETKEKFTFLMISRMIRDKGVVEFVEACGMLKAQVPNVNCIIVGGMYPDNPSAVSRLEVQSWIDQGLIQHVEHVDDIRPYIVEASCVVLPSYREGLPRSLLEASAMCRPIIATDVPGCRDVVLDGKTGFLVKARDAKDLAQKMEAILMLNNEEREKMGLAARRFVETHFDEKLVIRKYFAALNELK